jgi:hypothetical protein
MTSRVLVVTCLIVAAASSSDAQRRREVRRVGLDEQAALTQIVDNAAEGKHTEGNAWLTWVPHFLRGPDRKTYIPFTLKVEEAPGAFRSAAMYVRVAPRGDLGRAGRKAEGVQNALGVATGEMPVNSAASSQLATVQSGFGVPPGEYDLYIALLERDVRGQKKWAVLKQPITVPDLATSALRMSSVILADRVEPLRDAVPEAERPLRPYVFGSSELVPATDDELRSDETLHVAFLIYDATPDGAGKPEVRVEYRLFQQNFSGERLLGATAPQMFDASTLPADFDVRTGQQLAAVQSLPLDAYKPGTYRLAIRVTDRRSGATTEESVRFVLIGM